MKTEHAADKAQGEVKPTQWTVEGEGMSWSVLRCVDNGTELVVADLSHPQAKALAGAHNTSIAAAQQPLVDALTKIRKRVVPSDPVAYMMELQDIAAAALAKEKKV